MLGANLAHAQSDPAAHLALRELAAQPLLWRGQEAGGATVRVQILAINDFHGALAGGIKVGPRQAGGAALLAAYLKAEQQDFQSNTFIVHAGDHVGASPPISALLQDEPAIEFLNALGNEHCSTRQPDHPRCNVVAALGNHEFDEGRTELLRLIYGGTHARGPFLQHPYAGANYAHVCANVFDLENAEYLVPPYVVKEVDGVRIAFIGAVLRQTPAIVPAPAVAGLKFLDEAQAINAQAAALRRAGVRSIVVLLHQGGYQRVADAPDAATPLLQGVDINAIIKQLDDEIDVLVTGHAHAFTNARVPNANGKRILVTQAFFSGTAYGDIELEIDRASGEIIATRSAVKTTYADVDAGRKPDALTAALVARANEYIAPIVQRVVASAAADISNAPNEQGESAMGQLIADAQRASVGADIAVMNPGGVRWGLGVGPITWGDVFTVHPFGNAVVKIELSGAQVVALLNEQWRGTYPGRLLAVSGLRYSWHAERPIGERVQDVEIGGVPIELERVYTVAVNDFLLHGGDGFSTLKSGANRVEGPLDRDALIAYLRALPQPVRVPVSVRIRRIN